MYQPYKVIVANSITDCSLQHSDVPFADRGLQYGDGCFTTMYCDGSLVSLFEQHITRLVEDSARINIFVDPVKVRYSLKRVFKQALSKNKQMRVIKLILTRGVGGRGYELPEDPLYHLYVSFHPCTKYDHEQVNEYRIKACSFALSEQPLLAGIKHLNRLEQILAKNELQHLPENTKPIHDLIMSDQKGNVIECTAGNLFFFKNNVWHTPCVKRAGVDGLMRRAFIAYLQENDIPLKVGQYPIENLIDAESLFICNAIKHVLPVTEFEHNSGNKSLNVRFNNVETQRLVADFVPYLHTQTIDFSKLISE